MTPMGLGSFFTQAVMASSSCSWVRAGGRGGAACTRRVAGRGGGGRRWAGREAAGPGGRGMWWGALRPWGWGGFFTRAVWGSGFCWGGGAWEEAGGGGGDEGVGG